MICKAKISDAEAIAKMAVLMWDSNTIEDLKGEFEELIKGDESVIFYKSVDNQMAGFAQCQLRHDYVEGTDTSPVGYLEGIFVMPEYRNCGIAKDLLAACEEWSIQQGCTEFASDCELDNVDSLRFHLKMGFVEENRIICFSKKLMK